VGDLRPQRSLSLDVDIKSLAFMLYVRAWVVLPSCSALLAALE